MSATPSAKAMRAPGTWSHKRGAPTQEGSGRSIQAVMRATHAPIATPADRARAIKIAGGDARSIDSPGQHAIIGTDPSDLQSLAIWTQESDDTAELSWVQAPNTASFYALALAAAKDAIAADITTAHFTISDRRLLAQLLKHFRIQPVASAWSVETAQPVAWRIDVELKDAREQLLQRIDA